MDRNVDDDFLYAHTNRAEDFMLEQIPKESELFHIFSKKFNHKMKALLKYEKRTPFMRRFVRYSKTAIATILITISLTFAATMSVEAYRVRFFEIVTHIWEQLTSITISSNENAGSDILVAYEPTYLPDGYLASDRTSDKYEQTIIYTNSASDNIYFSQYLLTQGEAIIDTEGIESETIEIDGQSVTCIENKGVIQVYWNDSRHSFYIMGSMDKTELVRMAQSIIENN